MNTTHEPVLLQETMALLSPASPGVYADVTLGAAGHAQAILERSSPDGLLFGLDRDPHAIAAARDRLASFGPRVTLINAPFGELASALRDRSIDGVDGLVADLGLSSTQLDNADRGFSFRQVGPIDMRMDVSTGETALELIARLNDDALANVIYEYGEERRSRPIARSIRRAYEAGALKTTGDLRAAVVRVTGPKRGRIDPATRTFQALRIAVNDEIEQLRLLIASLTTVLRQGGVAAIISFHSLEDRLVKHAFRDHEALRVLTKRPVTASEEECATNPRARSAKLRAARLEEAL